MSVSAALCSAKLRDGNPRRSPVQRALLAPVAAFARLLGRRIF